LGSVSQIEAAWGAHIDEPQVLVILELQQGVITNLPKEWREKGRAAVMSRLIEEGGLRARLELQSLVTGQLYVSLDFYPRTEVHYRAQGLSAYPEIPTVESSLEKLGETLETIPLDQLMSKISNTLDGIDRAVNSPEVSQILKDTAAAAQGVAELAERLDARSEPLITSLQQAVDAARDTMVQVRVTLALREGVPGELAQSLKSASDAAAGAFAQAEQTLALDQGVAGKLATSLIGAAQRIQAAAGEADKALSDVSGLTATGSPVRIQLMATMQELSAAARSLRVLADYLERHPDALLRGKQ
jgi:paraquat-inducible protein B